MTIQMAEVEAWAFLDDSHTAILTTLRADGFPVSTPVWFITDDKSVLIAGLADSVKCKRIAKDPRVSVLAETGHAWRELRAVRIDGRAELVDDPDWESIDARFGVKYGAHRTRRAEMAPAAVRHYDRARALIRVVPTGPLVSWDNRKLRS